MKSRSHAWAALKDADTHTSAQAGCDLSEGMLLVELYFLNHKGNFPPHAITTLIKHSVTLKDMKTDTKK